MRSDKHITIPHETGSRYEIGLSLTLVFSLILHLFFAGFLVMPYIIDPSKSHHLSEMLNTDSYVLRDVIVNIDADDLEIESPYTLFSERSSSARGHMSEKRGDTWLNNSLTFTSPRPAQSASSGREAGTPPLLYTKEESTFQLAILEESKFSHPIEDLANQHAENAHRQSRNKDTVTISDQPALETSDWTKIPDKKGFTFENALYLTSDRRPIRFNTKKFSDFEYFRNMKQKIASNWYPPTLSNMRHYYAGGYTQSRLIASQEVFLYFLLNRNGDVLSVTLVDSKGNEYLDQSCIDAVSNSKNFGPLPASIEGEKIVIPFIFGFYVR